MFKESPINQLIEATSDLRMLHEDVCVTEHALYASGHKYMPYEPTFFLYNYFCFNTVFNIDWSASKKSGIIIYHEKKSEKDQIKSLVDVCFSDNDFVKSFLPTYRNFITIKYDIPSIIDAMQLIVPDYVRITKADVGTFQAACKRLLCDEDVDVRDIKSAYSFIYSIRCNIVHGEKSMRLMMDIEQRKRITTYSCFIIALLHMLFMSFQYERIGHYIESMSKYLLERIKH